MPVSDVLSVAIDTVEPRIQTDRMAVLVSGAINNRLQWDLANSSQVFVDYVTYSLWLQPYCYTDAWQTTTTGVYRRLHKADTNRAADTKWVEHVPNNVAGNIYLLGNGTNDPVTTHESFDKNRGWYFSFFCFGQDETFLYLQLTWGNVVLYIYSDGTVQVTKNGLQHGSGNLADLDRLGLKSSKDAPKGIQGAEPAKVTDFVSFIVLPCRRRELLFLCSRGGGFTVAFNDIEEDDPDPVILPAGPLTWQIPTAKPMLQYAPLTFFPSGYALSFEQQLREAPVASATANCASYWDKPYFGTTPTVIASFKESDGTTDFVGDDSMDSGIFRVDLTGDGNNTPFVYGGSAVFDAVTADTDGTHSVILDDINAEFELSVAESPTGVTARISCDYADTLDADLAASRYLGNRPIEAKIGSIAFLTGRTDGPRYEAAISDGASKTIFQCRDRWKAFELCEIEDPTPFDGMKLRDVIILLATAPGYPESDMDVEDFDFTFDSKAQASIGEWGTIPEAGDTVATWLLRIYDDYAKNAIVGWYPSATGPKFRFQSVEALGTTPDCTLYLTRASAVAALVTGGMSSADAELEWWKHTIAVEGYNGETWEPEANVIRVTGWDPNIDKAFQAVYRDLDSADPTLVPAERPLNWLGEPRRVSVFNPSLTTQESANYAIGIFRQRLTPYRGMNEIHSEMLFRSDGAPVWKGGVIAVDGLGSWRVRTLRGAHVIEDSGKVIRPYQYACELIV